MEPQEALVDPKVLGAHADDHGRTAQHTGPSDASSSDDVKVAKLIETDDVFLATGLHNPLTRDDLPVRFERGLRARLLWYGILAVAGLGMFMEAYIIITTGQIKTVWKEQYPTCWQPHKKMACPNKIRCPGLFKNDPANITIDFDYCTGPNNGYPTDVLCKKPVTNAVSYSEFAGIMAGQISFGFIGDLVGRSAAGVATFILQVLGVTVMSFINAPSLNTMFIVWTVFFAVYGLGTGGEYPLTAAGAAERYLVANNDAQLEDNMARIRWRQQVELAKTMRRGETIGMVFTMQGVGALVGSLVVMALIYFSQNSSIDCNSPLTNETGNDPRGLNAIWRAFYFIGLLMCLAILAYRYLVANETDSFEQSRRRKQMREQQLGSNSTFKILAFYWPRLVGTAGSWFVWDVAFYGNKLFSGPIFASLNPNGNLLTNNGYITLNTFVSLIGYYCACATIDKLWMGRRRMQTGSFFVCAVLFFISAPLIATLSKNHPGVLVFLYILSSFAGQFGANVTTYVLSAECYPTELRSTCHGISAFTGKGGALIATIVFSYCTTEVIFYITGAACALGVLFTVVFVPELTHVSLAEHDAQLELFLEGRVHEYKGELNNPKHLSLFERVFKRHGDYDPSWASTFVRSRGFDGQLSKL